MASLVPQHIGPESLDITASGVKAFAGTGFDPHSLQHRQASDAARYAIAIQQYRDAGDYEKVDAARKIVERNAWVMQEGDGTTVLPYPIGWHNLSIKDRKQRKPFVSAVVSDGMIYDA